MIPRITTSYHITSYHIPYGNLILDFSTTAVDDLAIQIIYYYIII